jgi:glycosyltransferase involved in cell wall biosynthesis
VTQALRVLHVAPTPFFSDRGCHIRIEGIVRGLNEKGVQSLVCTYHHGRERPGVDTLRIDPMDDYEDTQAGPNPHKYMADIKLFWLVCRCLRKQRPNLIHAHLHEGVLLGWAAKWALMKPRLPLVSDLQGSLVGELDSYNYFEKSKTSRRIFKWIESAILRMPGHIFCSSVSSLDLFQREYKLPRKRLTLLSDRVEEYAVNTKVRGRGQGQVTVIYSGALLEAKGLSHLLQILERLLTRRSDVRIVLVGYPTQEVAAYLDRKGLGDRCVLTGRIHYEDLPGYLANADIGLDPKLPGAGEGSGKILNYMAAGLPVVAFDSANNREFLGQQQDLVPDRSIEGFVARISFLIDHERVRRQEGDRNRQRVLDELTWDKGVELVLEVYDKLLHRK